ncbi:MAG: LysE family translocator [Gemmatimonadales bacterium]
MLFDARTLGFASVATMFVITPGVGTAVITRTVVERGREAGLAVIAGLITGSVLYALGTALGLAALLVAFPRVLRAVQLIGAVYVGWLGIATLRSAWRIEPAGGALPPAAANVYRTGLTTSLLNLMLAVFYLTVIPQFVAPGDNLLRRTLLLAAVHLTIAATWMLVLVAGIAHLTESLASAVVRRRIALVTGAVLLLLAIRLVVR